MAFKGGTPIQAGLGRADFSPLVRAGEFTGQGYADLGAGLSQGINQLSEMQKQKKEEQKQAKAAIEGLVGMAYKGAKDGFTVPGLGKLVKVKRKARMGRNPATGETIKIKAKTVLKFRIAKAAKDAVLG